MKIYNGCTVAEARDIAGELGIRFAGSDVSNSAGLRISGKLEGTSGVNPYPRRSRDRRMPHVVCWHGYRDFMRAVFERYPSARIVTGLMGDNDYRGAEDFERKYRASGYRNVGSMVDPFLHFNACDCEYTGTL